MPKILLIDGDVICYQIAAAAEKATDWGEDFWTLHADAKEGKKDLDAWVVRLKAKLEIEDFRFYFSSHNNFRKAILPTYKVNRLSTRKPMILGALKSYACLQFSSCLRDDLEADDALGITATDSRWGLDPIIVSVDKDFKQIPGKFYDYNHPELGIQTITVPEADYWHMYQTLAGDKTDGYTGCPGIGPVKADKILKPCLSDSLFDINMAWDLVIREFGKAGLGPEEALVQARVARILRATDFNFETLKPILWEPPTL